MLTLVAPAKINLSLHVQRRRSDGYHDIATIFLKVSLTDVLHLTAIPRDIVLQCDHPGLGEAQENLVYKAAAMLQPLAPGRGVHLQLHKTIPLAAGLGGGSSDAAATLKGLNTLWDLRLSAPELARYAARLGADVPFFLLPTVAAVGQGRGDELDPCPCPTTLFVVLVKPALAISTAWAYGQLKFELTARANDTTILRHYLESGDIKGVGALCYNDFEVAIFPQFPVLQTIQQALQHPGVYGSGMSGSGPTMYALCASQGIAYDVALAMQHRGWEVWVCRSWWDETSTPAS